MGISRNFASFPFVPDVEPDERVPDSSNENRIFGVVVALKPFGGDGGGGFGLEAKSTKAYADEFHVYFKSDTREAFDYLEVGSEVKFTLFATTTATTTTARTRGTWSRRARSSSPTSSRGSASSPAARNA